MRRRVAPQSLESHFFLRDSPFECTPLKESFKKSRVLYVADTANSRVLRYGSLDTISATTAVFGQLNFSGIIANQGRPTPRKLPSTIPLACGGLGIHSLGSRYCERPGGVVGQCTHTLGKRQPGHRLRRPIFVDQLHDG